MADLLTTKEILASLEYIIKKAEKYICIFTYNIRIDPNFLARLRNASKRGVKITIVFGVENGNDQLLHELLSIPNCIIYFKEYLHAKFFYNERELLIGSMNLSEASGKNNFELGVLFKGDDYNSVINKVKEEAKEIISDAIEWKSLKSRNNLSDIKVFTKPGLYVRNNKNGGSCIRCGIVIPFNHEKPFCYTCFQEWVEWENEYYIETYCHCCGERKYDITFAKPECNFCYNSH